MPTCKNNQPRTDAATVAPMWSLGRQRHLLPPPPPSLSLLIGRYFCSPWCHSSCFSLSRSHTHTLSLVLTHSLTHSPTIQTHPLIGDSCAFGCNYIHKDTNNQRIWCLVAPSGGDRAGALVVVSAASDGDESATLTSARQQSSWRPKLHRLVVQSAQCNHS